MSKTESGCSEPIENCLHRLQSLELFVEATQIGLDHAAQATGWVEVNCQVAKLFGRTIRDDDASLDAAKQRSEELESFAKHERSLGYPYLYGIAVARVWTIVETLVDDTVLMRFRARKYNFDSGTLDTVRVQLRAVFGADSHEQAKVVLNELKQTQRARTQLSVSRFESLLDAASLSGPMEDAVRDAIFECGQVRNLIVHRSGVTDLRFMQACPWFADQQGVPLPLVRNHYQLYYWAAMWYALAIQVRLDTAEGMVTAAQLLGIQAHALSNVKAFQASRPRGI